LSVYGQALASTIGSLFSGTADVANDHAMDASGGNGIANAAMAWGGFGAIKRGFGWARGVFKGKISSDVPSNGKSISTGRTEPTNLEEKLAMEEVVSNPAGVTPPRMPKMSDAKNNLLHEDGWVKRTQNVNGVEIHYVENINTKEVLDFKFVE